MNINYQLKLRPTIPTIYGPLDYRIFHSQLEEMDFLLQESGLEDKFIVDSINRDNKIRECIKNDSSAKNISGVQLRSANVNKIFTALRVNILNSLLNESCRDLAFRLADSSLCQWFIGVAGEMYDKTPSKSTIKRYENMWHKDDITKLVNSLNNKIGDSENSKTLLSSEMPLDFTHYYVDSTCIESNIHYPVDWLLLCDATQTIIAAIKTIRKQKLVHRMPFPNTFLCKMNKITMLMTEASRNRSAKGKKAQKRAFRNMKKVLRIVEKHAERYYELLENNWKKTKWSRKETNLVLDRIRNVKVQIDDIISLAHNRIIKGVYAKNSEKILSLYEKNVHVIKRGKANGEVEFGNGLYIAEQENGIIVDWDFFQEKPTSDAKILPDSIARINDRFDVESVSTDRGFNSKANSTKLDKMRIYDATCPRNVHNLKEKLKDKKFCKEQKRRAGTEARISIIKNKFIGKKITRKGFRNKEIKVLWAFFAHNIWVIARLSLENQEKNIRQKVA